jgi:hypothetical protein
MMTRLHALVVLGLLFGPGLAPTADAAGEPRTSSGMATALGQPGRDAQRRAIDTVPLDRMAPAERQVAEHLIRRCTLAKRLPAAGVTCDPAFLDFILAKPETLVDVWRVLGISQLALDPTGPGGWRFADGYGTVGSVRLLHRERNERGGLAVFHGSGRYDGPLSPKPLTGSCLVVVRHAADAKAAGPRRQTVQIDAFLDVDGVGLELVTRTLQPLIIRSAATNVHEISLFISQFAAAAARNPTAVARIADRMTRTSPEDRRTLVTLAAGPGAARTSAAAHDDVHAELASRWMTAEQLEELQRERR